VSTWMEEHAPLRRLIIFNSSTDLIMKRDMRCARTLKPFARVVSSDQIRGMFRVVTRTLDG